MTKARDIADSDLGSLTVDTDTLVVDETNNRVGIGTSSPSEALSVRASSNVAVRVRNNSDSIAELALGNAGSPDFLLTQEDGETAFTHGTTERMRIDSSGRLLVGKSSASDSLQGVRVQSNGQINISADGTVGNKLMKFLRDGGVEVGNILTTGTSTSYNTSSDYRLKENVVDMANSIDRVKALPVRRFNFIADPDKTVDGFLAHEAQEIVPEAVTGEKDEVEAIGNVTDAEGVVVQEGVIEPSELPEDQAWTKTGDRPVMQGIDQGKLVPLLTGALKEAIEKIELLEARIEALEAN